MSKIRSATYFTIMERNPKTGKDELVSISETQFNKLVEEAKGATPPTEPPEALRQQTFTLHEAESIEDIQTMCPDLSVGIDLFNRGASLKQLNEIRDLMESALEGDDSFATVEGSYDLADVIGRKTERRKMSPLDKALKALGNLTDDEKQQLVAKLLAAQTASA